MKKASQVNMFTDIVNLLTFGSPTLIIFFLALFTLLWGLWFLAPWEVMSTTPTFDMMRQMLPENVWGIIFTIVGTAKLYLLSNYMHTKRVRVSHIVTNFVIFFIWSVVFSSILVSNWQSTGTLTYGFVVGVSLWSLTKRWNEFKLERMEGAVNG